MSYTWIDDNRRYCGKKGNLCEFAGPLGSCIKTACIYENDARTGSSKESGMETIRWCKKGTLCHYAGIGGECLREECIFKTAKATVAPKESTEVCKYGQDKNISYDEVIKEIEDLKRTLSEVLEALKVGEAVVKDHKKLTNDLLDVVLLLREENAVLKNSTREEQNTRKTEGGKQITMPYAVYVGLKEEIRELKKKNSEMEAERK